MKYFYDAEFLEGKQRKTILGIPFGKTKPTIDLISIGIVCEDGREYYAISKDFNLKEAWNRWDGEFQEQSGYEKYHQLPKRKKYWIRENVLIPIFFELAEREFHNIHFKDEWTYEGKVVDLEVFKSNKNWTNNFTWLKKLIKKYGKTNISIAKEIKNFCYSDKQTIDFGGQILLGSFIPNEYPNIEFYGYYSAYDHVALCWLFGRMIDLPKGFPMYSKDLKQISDSSYSEAKRRYYNNPINEGKSFISELKLHPIYPKQSNEHNALADAKWNKDLFNFLEKIEYGTIIR